jgi:hypothetical protein
MISFAQIEVFIYNHSINKVRTKKAASAYRNVFIGSSVNRKEKTLRQGCSRIIHNPQSTMEGQIRRRLPTLFIGSLVNRKEKTLRQGGFRIIPTGQMEPVIHIRRTKQTSAAIKDTPPTSLGVGKFVQSHSFLYIRRDGRAV